MTDATAWWLSVEVMGAMAFPITFLLLRFVPDRGYSVSKIVGILLTTYLLWIGGSVHVISNSRRSIVLVLILIAVASCLIAWRHRQQLASFFRQRWPVLLFNELLFAATFAYTLFYRARSVDVNVGERPFDTAFISAILRADYFPPLDPWLSGHSMNYYYFGHLSLATIAKLTDTPGSIAFNISLGLITALIVGGAFGLLYNLIIERARLATAVLFGLLAPILLTVLGNLEGLFELLAVHGVGSKGFYDLVDIAGLDGPRESTAWYPTEWLWFERAYYFTGDAPHVFPYVRFFGGWHNENLALPFGLLAIVFALSLWRSSDADIRRLRISDLPFFLFLALTLGSLNVTLIWYTPAFFLLIAVVLALRSYLAEGRLSAGVVGRTLALLAALLVLAVVLYLPFYQVDLGAFAGIAIVEPEMATRPHHLLYMWLPLLWLTVYLAAICMGKVRPTVKAAGIALTAPILILLSWALTVSLQQGPADLAEQIADRGWDWLTPLVLLSALSLICFAAVKQASLARNEEGPRGSLFALILGGIAVLMLAGIEFFWVDDRFFQPRFNTVLKGDFLAWSLLGISGAFALYLFATTIKVEAIPRLVGKLGWGGVTAVILLAGMVYPVTTTFFYTDSFRYEPNLDLLWQLRQAVPAEYEAIVWLRDNVDGSPVILEAVGPSWSGYARISAYSGLPTVLGWTNHELHWRGSPEPLAGREEAVSRIYQTADPAEATALLKQFDVEYVYVGPIERQLYGEGGMGKFATFMDVAFQEDEVTIYSMREAVAAGQNSDGITSGPSGPPRPAVNVYKQLPS